MPDPISPQRGPAPTGNPNERRRRRRRGGKGRRRGGAVVPKRPVIQLEPINLPEVIASAPLTAYCRDCRNEVTFILAQGKARCTTCQGPNVAFGTPISVRNYFRLSSDGVPRRRKEQ